jgi:hypothetical protein
MSTLPNILRVLPDGTLVCTDGRDVKAYLADWAAKVGADHQTPVNIMRSDDQQRERDDAFLLRNLGA